MELPLHPTMSPCSRIEEERISKAVRALLKWENSRAKRQKSQLLEDDSLLYLVVSLKKIPDQVKTNPHQIPIPYPLFAFDGSQDVCLFVNDRKGATKKEAKLRIAEEKIPVAKVIGLSKLRTDYKAFEEKRKLCSSYDLFLADKSILPTLPKLLGKGFFKKKKHPIPVDLTKKDWSKTLEAACGSAFLYLKGGTCSVVKVGRISQNEDEIVENIKAIIEGVAYLVPKQWKNIRALYLKTLESVALPLYQALPELSMKIGVPQAGSKPSRKDGGRNEGRINLAKHVDEDEAKKPAEEIDEEHYDVFQTKSESPEQFVGDSTLSKVLVPGRKRKNILPNERFTVKPVVTKASKRSLKNEIDRSSGGMEQKVLQDLEDKKKKRKGPDLSGKLKSGNAKRKAG